jgi:hypothetical protein
MTTKEKLAVPVTTEEPARLPYDAEFMQRTENFIDQSLQAIPELQGLAIVPLWTRQPEKFPPGFLKLRAQNGLYVAELLKLISLFTAFSADVHKDFMSQVQILDNYLREMQNKLQETQASLNASGNTADAP